MNVWPAGAVKFEAGGFPVQLARRQKAPRDSLKVCDCVLVVDLVNDRRQTFPPVVHQALVLLDPHGDVPFVVGPPHAAKASEPARHGDIAWVAPTMNERGIGKEYVE